GGGGGGAGAAGGGRGPGSTWGRPMTGFPDARRTWHASASSQPPPNAKPLTAAITGFGLCSSRSTTDWPKREMSSAAAGPSGASSLMSAPEMNPFSPCPVTTSAFSPGAAPNARSAPAVPPRASRLMAFRPCRRLTNSPAPAVGGWSRRFLKAGMVDVLMARTLEGVAADGCERATIGPAPGSGNRSLSVEAVVGELLLRAREAALVRLARLRDLAHPAGGRGLAAPHGRAPR